VQSFIVRLTFRQLIRMGITANFALDSSASLT